MLCSNCKKRPATLHYKETINGVTHEAHLCQECAIASGYAEGFHDPLDFGSILNEFLGIGVSGSTLSSAHVCPDCGTDFETFRTTGLMGCEHCYEKFEPRLDAMLSSIQTGTTHKGKTSSKEDNQKKEKESKIEGLKQELKKKIQEEKYEEAAKIRDQIKELEGKDNE